MDEHKKRNIFKKYKWTIGTFLVWLLLIIVAFHVQKEEVNSSTIAIAFIALVVYQCLFGFRLDKKAEKTQRKKAEQERKERETISEEAWKEQKNNHEEEKRIKRKETWIALAFNFFAGCIYLIPIRLVYGGNLKWIQKGVPVLLYFLITFPFFAFWITSFPKRKRQGLIKPMELILILPFILFPFMPMLLILFNKKFLISYIPFVIGWEFCAMAIGYMLQTHQKEEYCTIPATATVVDNIKSMMHSSVEKTTYIPTYHIVLEYYAYGHLKHITCDDGQPQPLAIGTILKIYYNPDKPEEFRFETGQKPFTEKYAGFIFLGIGIILFIAVACIIIFF